MKNKEITLNFINWDNDEIVLELARYIEKGFHIVNTSMTCSKCEMQIEVYLMQYEK